MDERGLHAMEDYYAAMPREGYAGRCRMVLPDDLAGKRVLDVLCRNGKGACKIADKVGTTGFVLGVDPDPACIERARSYAAANIAHGADGCRIIAFERGFPEGMRMTGAEEASFDVVVANSALNLAWDLEAALQEIARLLNPNGFLYLDGLFADEALPADEIRAFAARGNVFGAARTRQEFERIALGAGFARCAFDCGAHVAPEGSDAAIGEGHGPFEAAIAFVAKKRESAPHRSAFLIA